MRILGKWLFGFLTLRFVLLLLTPFPSFLNEVYDFLRYFEYFPVSYQPSLQGHIKDLFIVNSWHGYILTLCFNFLEDVQIWKVICSLYFLVAFFLFCRDCGIQVSDIFLLSFCLFILWSDDLIGWELTVTKCSYSNVCVCVYIYIYIYIYIYKEKIDIGKSFLLICVIYLHYILYDVHKYFYKN